MHNYRNKLVALLTLLTAGSTLLYAQNDGFDLNAQRRESQRIYGVDGEAVDHKGLIVNPTPHSIDIVEGGQVDITTGIRIKKGYASELSFLPTAAKGLPVSVEAGAKIAAKKGVKSLSGAYRLTIGKKGIEITGYDDRGAFYGIQTLRQIAESPAAEGGKLPCLQIDDYPDIKHRGTVEGFYGTPWSHQVRLSLIDFYGRNKLNTYIYGPKDDPYHSSPNWRLPYPADQAAQIGELVEACNRNRVDFVWAIHPGKDIKWNEEDFNNLTGKFEMMYALGVRAFAIFFDDIEGEGTNPIKQVELLNRLKSEFVDIKGDIASLVMCPTDYSKLWANPTPKGSLSIFGNTLDRSVDLFWTGDAVCSDLTKSTMDWFNSRIKRAGYYWWNFPVTDYARHIVMQGPTYGLDRSLTPDDIVGLVSNPMEHGEASKLAIYGVADYAWNVAAYNPLDNWERALSDVAPEVKDAYRTFAIHSCDTETGYRRAESWETQTFTIDNYTEEGLQALVAEFEKIEQASATIQNDCRNRALVDELHPWLVEFGKLGTRGRKAIELIATARSGDNAAFWNSYIDNLMSTEQRADYKAHKSGTMKLQPFYENAMDDLLFDFYTRLSGDMPSVCRSVGSFGSLKTIQGKLMFDNDPTTFYTSGTSQTTGSWIGADLRKEREVSEISILQGRNSIDDVDYFDNAALEYSLDGNEWKQIGEPFEKQYEIRWSGEPVVARYVRLRKLPSDKRNWAAVRSFDVNPIGTENRFGVSADAQNAIKVFDNNPFTSFVGSKIGFDVKADAKECIVLAKLGDSPITIGQLSAEGNLLSQTTAADNFVRFAIDSQTARIEIEGNAEIFEILMK